MCNINLYHWGKHKWPQILQPLKQCEIPSAGEKSNASTTSRTVSKRPQERNQIHKKEAKRAVRTEAVSAGRNMSGTIVMASRTSAATPCFFIIHINALPTREYEYQQHISERDDGATY